MFSQFEAAVMVYAKYNSMSFKSWHISLFWDLKKETEKVERLRLRQWNVQSCASFVSHTCGTNM